MQRTTEQELALEEQQVLQQTLNLNALESDITSQEINFDGVDDDLVLFQQNEIVREALAKGLDLRRYSQAVASELKSHENLCVADYIAHADDLADLHEEIRKCDSALDGMEHLLSRFQHDLGSISKEISQLQSLSLSLGVRLKNHSAVERRLTAFLKHAYISPDLKNVLSHDTGLTEQLGEALYALSRKLYFLNQPKIQLTQSAQDVIPAIRQLLGQSVTRVRKGLIDFVQSLKAPLTNIQVKQGVMLRHKRCYDFILNHCQREGLGDIAAEIRQFYVETVANTYLAQVRAYFAPLKKSMTKSHVSKNDLMGSDSSTTSGGGFFSFGGSNSGSSSISGATDDMLRVFSLGQRELGLSVNSTTIALKHTAMQSSLSVSFERAFKMLMQLVLDTATTEYHFLWEFYGYGSEKVSGSSDDSTNKPAPSVNEASSTSKKPSTSEHGHSISAGNKTDAKPSSTSNAGTSSSKFEANEVHASSSGYFDYVDSSDEEEDQALAAANRFAALALNMENPDGTSGLSLPPPPSVLEARNRTSIKSIVTETKHVIEEDMEQLKNLRSQHARSMFHQIFVRIFAYLEENLSDHVSNCWDSLDLLLLSRVISEFHRLMHQRQVYFVLDVFFERLNAMIWPRFKTIFQANLTSLRVGKFTIPKKPPIRPHFTGLRYAMYASAISYYMNALSLESADVPVLAQVPLDPMSPTADIGQTHAVVPITSASFLKDCVRDLHSTIDSLTQSLMSSIDVPKNRTIFKIVTYDLICRAMITHGVDIRSNEVLRTHFSSLQQAITDFIDGELSEKFGKLVNFVRDIEQQASAEGSSEDANVAELKVDDSVAESVSRHFASNWRVLIESLGASIRASLDSKHIPLIPAPPLAVANLVEASTPRSTSTSQETKSNEISSTAKEANETASDDLATSAMALFDSHNTAGEIHKAVLLQVGLYYRKFLDVLEQIYSQRQPAFLREVIPLQTVLQEIRRLSMRP